MIGHRTTLADNVLLKKKFSLKNGYFRGKDILGGKF